MNEFSVVLLGRARVEAEAVLHGVLRVAHGNHVLRGQRPHGRGGRERALRVGGRVALFSVRCVGAGERGKVGVLAGGGVLGAGGAEVVGGEVVAVVDMESERGTRDGYVDYIMFIAKLGPW